MATVTILEAQSTLSDLIHRATLGEEVVITENNLPQWMNKAIADLGIVILPITVEYSDKQIGLLHHHRDPFDRILASQAIVEGIPLLSKDVRIW